MFILKFNYNWGLKLNLMFIEFLEYMSDGCGIIVIFYLIFINLFLGGRKYKFLFFCWFVIWIWIILISKLVLLLIYLIIISNCNC